jgi:cation transport ATPase
MLRRSSRLSQRSIWLTLPPRRRTPSARTERCPSGAERARRRVRIFGHVGKTVGYCSLAILIALYVVGAVSITPGSLRHEVQTLPLWVPIVAGLQHKRLAKWAALPCFVFWLAVMIAIWLFLLGWARIVAGRFLPTEIAMTLVIGAASLVGIVTCVRWRTAVGPVLASGVVVLFAVLQYLAFRLSLLPYIAGR